jgi:hypothetical protein
MRIKMTRPGAYRCPSTQRVVRYEKGDTLNVAEGDLPAINKDHYTVEDDARAAKSAAKTPTA